MLKIQIFKQLVESYTYNMYSENFRSLTEPRLKSKVDDNVKGQHSVCRDKRDLARASALGPRCGPNLFNCITSPKSLILQIQY